MKKLALSGTLVLLFIFYGLHQRQEDNSAVVIAPRLTTPQPSASASAETTVNTTDNTATYSPTSRLPSSPTPAGKYRDGSYTGSVADAYYGNIQVKAIINGGMLTGVQFLQYPNDRGTSIRINNQAMPYLQQEAIQRQSAQVDGVSGASDTSAAFKTSLTSALHQAS